jgi:hypothetical protein
MPELEHQNEKLTQDLSLSLARQHNQKDCFNDVHYQVRN